MVFIIAPLLNIWYQTYKTCFFKVESPINSVFKTKPFGRYTKFDKYVSGSMYRTITGAAIGETKNMIKGLWKDGDYKQAIISSLEFPLIVYATTFYGIYGNNKEFVEKV